jgi:pimeloyl-ACP methyl ester carboxylesterase
MAPVCRLRPGRALARLPPGCRSDTVRRVIGTLDRPGGALAYNVVDATPRWRPAAPLIVLQHGIGATWEIWADWLPAVVDRYRIARFGAGPGRPPDRRRSPRLPAVVAPALLLALAQGRSVPLAGMAQIHAAIPGSELQVFADARHELLCSHGEACGRARRSRKDRRAAPAA